MFNPASKLKNNTYQNKELIAVTTILTAILVVGITLYVINLKNVPLKAQQKQSLVLGINEDLIKEEGFWVDFLSNNPSYFTGYIRLIQIEKELGNYNLANKYFTEAFEINPNSEELKDLK